MTNHSNAKKLEKKGGSPAATAVFNQSSSEPVFDQVGVKKQKSPKGNVSAMSMLEKIQKGKSRKSGKVLKIDKKKVREEEKLKKQKKMELKKQKMMVKKEKMRIKKEKMKMKMAKAKEIKKLKVKKLKKKIKPSIDYPTLGRQFSSAAKHFAAIRSTEVMDAIRAVEHTLSGPVGSVFRHIVKEHKSEAPAPIDHSMPSDSLLPKNLTTVEEFVKHTKQLPTNKKCSTLTKHFDTIITGSLSQGKMVKIAEQIMEGLKQHPLAGLSEEGVVETLEAGMRNAEYKRYKQQQEVEELFNPSPDTVEGVCEEGSGEKNTRKRKMKEVVEPAKLTQNQEHILKNLRQHLIYIDEQSLTDGKQQVQTNQLKIAFGERAGRVSQITHSIVPSLTAKSLASNALIAKQSMMGATLTSLADAWQQDVNTRKKLVEDTITYKGTLKQTMQEIQSNQLNQLKQNIKEKEKAFNVICREFSKAEGDDEQEVKARAEACAEELDTLRAEDAFPEKTGKIKDEMKALTNLINERVELQKLSAKSADVLRQAANKLASTSN